MDTIIEVKITDEMRQSIENNVKFNSVNNHKTLVGNEGKVAGFAGEEIVRAYLPFLEKDGTNYFDYDFVLPDGHTIDVKSKGNCKSAPKMDYDCTVPRNQINQKNDFYVFTRIKSDLSVGWIAGFITKRKFWYESAVRYAGDNYNLDGRKTVENINVCLISDLKPIHFLKEYYESYLLGQR